MEAIQTCEKGAFSLEMVPIRDATSAPESEVQLALPPGHRSVLPVVPRLVCHCNVSSERGVLIVGEDVWEFGKEVTSLVICWSLRESACFSLKWHPCPCFGSLCTLHSPAFKMGNRSILHLFLALRVGGWTSLPVSSRITTAGSISAPR